MSQEARRTYPAGPRKLAPGRIVASSVLTISAALAAPVSAQEPDQTQEGAAAPEAPGDPELDSPSFDPGGGDTPLTDIPAPSSGPDDTELEQEPVDDPDISEPSPEGDQFTGPTGDEAPASPTEEVVPEAPAPPTSPSLELPPPPASGPKIHRLQPEGPPARSHDGIVRLVADSQAQIGRPAAPPSDDGGGTPRITARPLTGSGPEVAENQLVVNARARTGGDDARVHVVARGESLWAIAADLLGPGASAARIAREVQRLWSLNEARIGTGDPDLLMVGTELRLR